MTIEAEHDRLVELRKEINFHNFVIMCWMIPLSVMLI
jgi:hypothetical protein